MSDLASVDCGLCEGSGHARPGATAVPGVPAGDCAECYPYRAFGYPPGKKRRQHKDYDPPTDYERRARALARALPDEPTFTYDPHYTRPRRRTRHRHSWPDLPRMTTEFPPQFPLAGRWNHFRHYALAIKRPGDIQRFRRPIGNITREVLQELPPEEIADWLHHRRLGIPLLDQATLALKRADEAERHRLIKEARQAKFLFYSLCGVAILVLIAGILTINLVVNR